MNSWSFAFSMAFLTVCIPMALGIYIHLFHYGASLINPYVILCSSLMWAFVIFYSISKKNIDEIRPKLLSSFAINVISLVLISAAFMAPDLTTDSTDDSVLRVKINASQVFISLASVICILSPVKAFLHCMQNIEEKKVPT